MSFAARADDPRARKSDYSAGPENPSRHSIGVFFYNPLGDARALYLLNRGRKDLGGTLMWQRRGKASLTAMKSRSGTPERTSLSLKLLTMTGADGM